MRAAGIGQAEQLGHLVERLAGRIVARAAEELGYATAVIGGGVACNRTLAAALTDRLAGQARVSVASPRLNTDNAAMIAAAGAWRLARGELSGWDLEPRDDLPLSGLTAVTETAE